MIKKLLIVMVGLLVLPMIANADLMYVDLLTKGASATVNGAIFSIPLLKTGGAGSGAIDSFLRIQLTGAGGDPVAAASERGYNTDGALEFDTKGGAFTHSLSLADVQTNIVEKGGIQYYEFLLDANETSGNSLITLLELEIYILGAPNLTGYSFGATPDFDLFPGDQDPNDSDPDGVTIDYDLFAGSGGIIDMIALIPVSSLPPIGGDPDNSWIYFYSKFGQPDDVVDDGFEEWTRKEEGTFTPPENGNGDGAIPEPGTLILLGSGLAGLAGYGKLRFRRKKK